uniref:Uncharacterized protein n=1 Tax=Arundo donax TaxID=35708 RepID=A0A0A9E774_ARUDO
MTFSQPDSTTLPRLLACSAPSRVPRFLYAFLSSIQKRRPPGTAAKASHVLPTIADSPPPLHRPFLHPQRARH